jgi:hypothetical protein
MGTDDVGGTTDTLLWVSVVSLIFNETIIDLFSTYFVGLFMILFS